MPTTIGLLSLAVIECGNGCLIFDVPVEAMQLLANRGWFGLSEIVLNVLCAALGYGICAGIYVTLRTINESLEKRLAG